MNYFKYMSIGTAELVLQNQTLRWSSPLVFNDIEECQLLPWDDAHFLSSYESYLKVLKECVKGRLIFNYNYFSPNTLMIIQMLKVGERRGEDFTSSLNEIVLSRSFEGGFRQYINEGLLGIMRVICVTSNCNNKLMWAHYADQHRGCSLEFSSLFIDQPNNLMEGYVEYKDTLTPSVSGVDMFLYGETSAYQQKIKKDIFFTKGSVWNYENEYRLSFNESFGKISTSYNFQNNEEIFSVSGQTDSKYTDVKFPSGAIQSITFGVRVEEFEIGNIKELALLLNPKCSFYQMIQNGSIVTRVPLDLA
ncbi:DUF2971 domain-containing protein [Marinomonas sp. UCMA 3892]|uniref:DUF2971 domain-containing protein n=1 Tax=unclassified Marinomonas TaxID=196814 RepID=UPI00146B246B|nr:DUF2971 domain-containing protein [Marinomonas sp. UCMA 3892]NLU98535.1 DUF2971 domain-containing protein [Marinomonas sp. UCMA 3892]